MFTQCPERSLSFRVTADVLKQAAGKVRCGGCRNTFNALDYLSEDKPGKERRRAVTGAPPELEAEPGDEPYNEPPPAAVSPEQSRKLLETLERLAESDVRIEDTGVEWRILSMEDDPDSELPDDDDEDVASAARGDDPESLPLAEELRFDDNTGLPDDFDLDAPVASRPRQPEAEPVAEKSHIDTHVDIAFGDPETDERADGQPESVPELAQDGGPGDSLERELAEMNELLERVEPDSTGGIEVELEETHRDLEDSSIDEDLFAAAFESERRAKQRRGDTDMADDEIELHLDADLPTDQEDGSSAPEFREYDESLALDLESSEHLAHVAEVFHEGPVDC